MITYKKFIKFLIPWIVFAFIMNMSRFALTDVHSYLYMNWNLFLALLPLPFVFFFENSRNIYFKVLSFILWLFVLPNAPYMVTDLLHLRNVGPEWLLWFDGMMIFSYAIIGVFVLSFTMVKIKRILFNKSQIRRNIFLILISIISSFGIYLGRYIRFNSWDIFIKPRLLMNNIIEILSTKYSHPVFITTMLFFTLFIMISTISFRYLFIETKKEA